MKSIAGIVIFSCFSIFASAQHISPANFKLLTSKEDSLQPLAFQIVNGKDEGARKNACSEFIPGLVQALKIKNSFYYPFDSLKEISILYPEDSSFRIFTWQMPRTLGFNQYFGAIQMNTADGDLKLFPLFDNSQDIYQLQDSVMGPKEWIGCLYYNLVETQFETNRYYTLFGYNGNSLLSNKKVLEMLTFQHGEPVFGAPVFEMDSGTMDEDAMNRFILEYKKDGNAEMNYDPNLQMIVYDELVSVNNQPQAKYTYVPDGNYEGFMWENGIWQHVGKVFNQPRGNTPVPHPLKFPKNIMDMDTMHVDHSNDINDLPPSINY